jgi:hypothetical protein
MESVDHSSLLEPVLWEESVARKQRDADIFLEYLEARLKQARAELHDAVARHGMQHREAHAALNTVQALRQQVEAQRAFVREIQRLVVSLHLHPELREFYMLAQRDW